VKLLNVDGVILCLLKSLHNLCCLSVVYGKCIQVVQYTYPSLNSKGDEEVMGWEKLALNC